MLSYVQLSLILAAMAVSLVVGGLLARKRLGRVPAGLGAGLLVCMALGLISLMSGPQPLAAQEGAAPAPEAAATAPAETPAAEATAEAPDATAAPAAQDWRQNGWLKLAVVLAVLVLPFMISNFLATRWRMPDYATKFTIILLTIFASIAIIVMGWPPRLGIDLRGGVILIYEIQEDSAQTAGIPDEAKQEPEQSAQANGEKTPFDMDKLVAAVSRRVNPGGVKEVTIRPFGAKQIEIIIPEADEAEVDRTEKIISSVGTLEFRILANDRDHKSLIERARSSDDTRLYDDEGNLLAWWVPVTSGQELSFQGYEEIATRDREIRGQPRREILVVKDIFDVTGDFLARASTGIDQTGRPKVDFVFNTEGGRRFSRLTGNNLPDDVQGFSRKLGIILDNNLYSAPAIRSTIGQQGEITGSFTKQETEDLVNVLNAGSLPAALSQEPISRLYTGPLLGRDTIEKGLNSIIISMALVFLSVLIYYRFPGIVACIALALNGIMLLAIMIMIKAAFTLPGLAGFALTLGMAVDANVLIFERMREETSRGVGLRMTIRNGFSRALSAIVDSNLTTMITAAVLYMIGTDQIRGFAVTLFLGIVLSMYTAIYVARVIFDVAEKRKWISEVKMMRALGETHFDFLRPGKLMIGISTVLILIGLVACFQRGRGLFDIDFTGGVSLQVVFDEPQDIGDIRYKLEDLPDVVVSDVRVTGEPAGHRFMVNTSTPGNVDVETYLNQVKGKLREIFGAKLLHNQVKIGAAKPIAEAAAQPAGTAKPSPKDQSRRVFRSSTRLEASMVSMALLGQEAGKGEAEAKQEAKPEAKPVETPVVSDGPDAATQRRFAGGTMVPLEFSQPINQLALENAIQDVLAARNLPRAEYAILDKQFQEVESSQLTAEQWNLLLSLSPEQAKDVLEAVAQKIESEPFFPSSNTIGGAVADNTRTRAVYALLGSTIIILIYLWVRFQRVSYGLGAVASLVHDVLLTLGFVGVSYYLAPVLGFLLVEPFKVNLAVMAAFLTVAGYSLNDTIVIYDRIREVRGKSPHVTADMINLSVNQTLGRTLLTGVTSMMVIVILYIAGGASIHGFAFSMIVGVITGTYSSIYIASPALLWLSRSMDENQAASKRSS